MIRTSEHVRDTCLVGKHCLKSPFFVLSSVHRHQQSSEQEPECALNYLQLQQLSASPKTFHCALSLHHCISLQTGNLLVERTYARVLYSVMNLKYLLFPFDNTQQLYFPVSQGEQVLFQIFENLTMSIKHIVRKLN